MGKPRDLQAVQTDYNQKLHRLGTLNWQVAHLIPREIEQIEIDLKSIEKEAQLLQKVANAAAAEKAKTEAKNGAAPLAKPGVEAQSPVAQQ